MGPKSKQQNKCPFPKGWEWLEQIDPDKISCEEIKKAYRVDARACERSACRINCKKNPNCHNCLGERFWFGEIKDDYWVTIEDPEVERKEKGNYVGLKNLGATCYVNTFLQLWFHNSDFLSAIFQWVPSQDFRLGDITDTDAKINEESGSQDELPPMPIIQVPLFGGSGPDNICGNLQLLFALMKYSAKRYVDPSLFVQSLGLQTDEQQDAQEFSKLFMSLLEDTLNNQVNPGVRNLVQDQFGGNYAYLTECSKCGNASKTVSRFYELDLSIQGHFLLKECIKEFLQVEKLDGENKYFCQNCHQKQDASRRIVLQSLPPVLNLQLLRFVFDRNSGSKKKLNSSLNFPEVLDMNEFMELKDPLAGIYELTAVLIHRGTTAYSGHYVAHIQNKQNGSWYRFNDETVEKMKGKTLQLGCEEDLEDSRNGKGKQKIKSPQGSHSSKNAYMLVYTKKQKLNEAKTKQTENPPEFIQGLVAKDNSEFEKWIDEVNGIKEKMTQDGKDRQKLILAIYSEMLPKDDDVDYEWMITEWIRQWLSEKEKGVPPVNNTSLLCKHSRVDPLKVHLMKRISSSSANTIFANYGVLPRLQSDSLCRDCVLNRCKQMKFDVRIQEDHKFINADLKVKLSGGEQGYWVGRMSLRQWKNLAITKHQENNLNTIKNEENSLEDSPNSSLCDKMTVDSTVSTKDGDNKDADVSDKEIETEDDERKQLYFNEDVLCSEHGNLRVDAPKRELVSSNVWNRLTYYFPEAPGFSSDCQPCMECMKKNSAAMEKKNAHRLIAQEMKNSLSSLYHDKNRPLLDRTDAFQVYIVAKSFLNEWRKFIRSCSGSPPEGIDNTDILCFHNLSLYRAEDFIDEIAQNSVVFLEEEEWWNFTKAIPSTTEIMLFNQLKKGEESSLMLIPECCEDCRSARLQEEAKEEGEFYYAPIYIRKLTQDDTTSQEQRQHENDMGPTSDEEIIEDTLYGSKRQAKESPVDDPDYGKSAKRAKHDTQADNIRRSSRHRNRRGEYAVRVDSNQTLKELKVQLITLFSVIPIDQHLSLENGATLNDDQEILKNLGIRPGCTVLLKTDDPIEDQVPIEETSNGERRLEEGFKGTGLCSNFSMET